MVKKLNLKFIKHKIGADTISRTGNIYTIRKGHFYTFGKTSKDWENNVLAAFPKAKIIDSGDRNAAFRGGQSIRSGSHFWVIFELPEN